MTCVLPAPTTNQVRWAPIWANFLALLNCVNSGGGGGGVTSITATFPIVVTPSPLIATGVISLANSGVTPATYGDATHVGQFAVDAQGIVTSATSVAISASAVSITATSPIVVTPSPITGTGVVSHATSGVTPSTYGDSTHTAQVTVDADGHVTAASSVFIPATAGSEWIASGLTPTFVSATQFTVPGNNTSTLTVGRRLESTNTAGTIYSTITASVFTTLTTVTVVNDGGSLDSGLSFVAFGILQAINRSIPVPTYVRVFSTTTTALSTFGPSLLGSGGTPTVYKDTLSEWSAGTFTCKQAGTYCISAFLSLQMAAVTWLVQPQIGFGVPTKSYPNTGFVPTWYPTTGAVDLQMSADFLLNQGDTLDATTQAGFSAGTIVYHYDITISRAGT